MSIVNLSIERQGWYKFIIPEITNIIVTPIPNAYPNILPWIYAKFNIEEIPSGFGRCNRYALEKVVIVGRRPNSDAVGKITMDFQSLKALSEEHADRLYIAYEDVSAIIGIDPTSKMIDVLLKVTSSLLITGNMPGLPPPTGNTPLG